MYTDSELLNNLHNLHTTELGAVRIKQNMQFTADDVIEWCKLQINSDGAVIERQGKNWYVTADDCIITINAHSFTVITAQMKKRM